MTMRVFLKAGDDLSWEGEAELELSVGPVIRGRFLNMHILILNGVAHRTDVTLHIEERRYELMSVERSGAFEGLEIGLSGSGPL
jgi:hypothetical protein